MHLLPIDNSNVVISRTRDALAKRAEVSRYTIEQAQAIKRHP
jgi:hypothetical protein